LSSNK